MHFTFISKGEVFWRLFDLNLLIWILSVNLVVLWLSTLLLKFSLIDSWRLFGIVAWVTDGLVGLTWLTIDRVVRILLLLIASTVDHYFSWRGSSSSIWSINLWLMGLVNTFLGVLGWKWSFVFRGDNLIDDDKFIDFWSFNNIVVLLLVSPARRSVLGHFLSWTVCSLQVPDEATVFTTLLDRFLIFVVLHSGRHRPRPWWDKLFLWNFTGFRRFKFDSRFTFNRVLD